MSNTETGIGLLDKTHISASARLRCAVCALKAQWARDKSSMLDESVYL